MIRKTFVFAIRSFRKSVFMNFINVLSLTLGLSVFFLIALYLYQEKSYEKDLNQRDQLFQLSTHFYDMGNLGWTSDNLGHVLADLPAIERFTLFNNHGGRKVTVGDKEFENNRVLMADSSFFSVFDFELISGNPETVLNKPGMVVIKESVALRFFGTTDVIGQTLQMRDEQPLIINGISKDPHYKTQLNYDMVVSRPYTQGIVDNEWGSIGTYTYLKINKNSRLEDLNAQIESISEKYIYPLFVENGRTDQPFAGWRKSASYLGFFAEPLMGLRSDSDTKNLMMPPLNKSQFNTLSIIGIATLLICFINFVNISTAKSSVRMGEVAVKRILGSSRSWLILQFMLEAFMLILLASFLSLGLVEGVVQLNPGYLSGILGYSVMHSAEWMAGLGLFVVLLTICSGLYPALYLSSGKTTSILRPVSLKNGFSLFNVVLLRKVATVFQFILSIALVAGVITMFQQLNHLHQRDLGYESGDVFILNNTYKLRESTEAFKNQLMSRTAVSTASYADHFPNQTDIVVLKIMIKGLNDHEVPFTSYRADPTFFEAMDMEFVMGGPFNKPIDLDREVEPGTTYPVVINETAVRELGLKEPIGSIINTDRRVVGVVRDFVFSELRQAVTPVIIGQKNNRPYYKLAVKMNPGSFDISHIEEVWSQFTDEKLQWHKFSSNYDQLMEAENKAFKSVLTFSVFTIIISCLGLLGLAVFTVDQRVRELGIRKVLGASIQDIVRLIGWDFLKLILLAFVIAIPIAIYGLNFWLNDFADRINLSPGIFVLTAVITMVIVLSTVALQTIKAGRLNPVDALSDE